MNIPCNIPSGFLGFSRELSGAALSAVGFAFPGVGGVG
jgi:hypothetical protein